MPRVISAMQGAGCATYLKVASCNVVAPHRVEPGISGSPMRSLSVQPRSCSTSRCNGVTPLGGLLTPRGCTIKRRRSR